ncbi:DJ-1/PfpI family protein [Candidatus Dojkabacteria bacterium]|nr:DJ-1/PfpI family protein [Candidatus Dojkabacteria bacterium]
MKNVLLVIAPQGYQPLEFSTTLDAFKNAGYITEIASTTTDQATAMDGSSVKPNLSITDVHIPKYDCVVFIGGSGTTVYFNNATILSIAATAYKLGKVIGAICIAPIILANAGILTSIESTVFPGEVQALTSKGAIFINKPVVVSGKIVTANGPTAAIRFSQELIKLLK